MHAKLLELCLTRLFMTPLCSLPGSADNGILQARILKWVVMPSSRQPSLPRDRTVSLMSPTLQAGSLPLAPPGKPTYKLLIFSSVQSLSPVQLFATPWTTAHLASPAPGACSNSCPSSQWCHLTISFSVVPFSSCLQPFPASGSFLLTQFRFGGYLENKLVT